MAPYPPQWIGPAMGLQLQLSQSDSSPQEFGIRQSQRLFLQWGQLWSMSTGKLGRRNNNNNVEIISEVCQTFPVPCSLGTCRRHFPGPWWLGGSCPWAVSGHVVSTSRQDHFIAVSRPSKFSLPLPQGPETFGCFISLDLSARKQSGASLGSSQAVWAEKQPLFS